MGKWYSNKFILFIKKDFRSKLRYLISYVKIENDQSIITFKIETTVNAQTNKHLSTILCMSSRTLVRIFYEFPLFSNEIAIIANHIDFPITNV